MTEEQNEPLCDIYLREMYWAQLCPVEHAELVLSYRSFLLYLKSRGFGVGDEQEKFIEKTADWAEACKQDDN